MFFLCVCLSRADTNFTFRITGEIKETEENDEHEKDIIEIDTNETVLKFTDKQCCNVNLGWFSYNYPFIIRANKKWKKSKQIYSI